MANDGNISNAVMSLLVTAPPGAVPLLDASRLKHRSGEPARWPLRDGVLELEPGSGDVYADVSFPVFQLHLEFWLPLVPGAHGQDRGNGGVYLEGAFEIQLLDSAGQVPQRDTCGAIYQHKAADYDAALPAETWQRLDVAYRREEPGARITALLNGVLIHNQVFVPQPTPAAFQREPRPVILLQDHGARLRFRNTWVLASS